MNQFQGENVIAHRNAAIEELKETHGLTPSGFVFPDAVKNNKNTAWATQIPYKKGDGTYRINKPFTRNFSMLMGVSNTGCHGSRLGAIREAGFEVWDYSHATKEEEYQQRNRKSGMSFTRTRTVSDAHWEIDASAFWFAPEEPVFASYDDWAEWYVSIWSPFLEDDQPEAEVLEIIKTNPKVRGRYEKMLENALKNHDAVIICATTFVSKAVEELSDPEVSETLVSEAESWWNRYKKSNWSAESSMRSFLNERYFNKFGQRDTEVFTAWLEKAKILTETWVAETSLKEVSDFLKGLEQQHFAEMEKRFGKVEVEA